MYIEIIYIYIYTYVYQDPGHKGTHDKRWSRYALAQASMSGPGSFGYHSGAAGHTSG